MQLTENNLPTLNFQDFIDADGDQLTTDSLKVAAGHGKRHDNVLQVIRQRMADAGKWGLLNFKEISYTDDSGRKYPVISMTRNGYSFLVGKLRGKMAVQHQIAYIEAFDAMAIYLKNQREGIRFRCMEKELECKDSERRGTVHGKGLNLRKQEKLVLDPELKKLLAMAQPVLPLSEDE